MSKMGVINSDPKPRPDPSEVARITGIAFEEVIRLQRISIEYAVEHFLSEGEVDDIVKQGLIEFGQAARFGLPEGSDGIYNVESFLEGALGPYFEMASLEGQNWYAAHYQPKLLFPDEGCVAAARMQAALDSGKRRNEIVAAEQRLRVGNHRYTV